MRSVLLCEVRAAIVCNLWRRRWQSRVLYVIIKQWLMNALSPSKSSIKRVARLTAGLALLPIGVAMLVLPGPGLLLLLSSLMLLEEEFSWAARVRIQLHQLTVRGRDWLFKRRGA